MAVGGSDGLQPQAIAGSGGCAEQLSWEGRAKAVPFHNRPIREFRTILRLPCVPDRDGSGHLGFLFGGRGARGRGRCEDETVADQSKAWLGEFGLQELVFGPGEQVGIRPGDGGDQVVDQNRLAIEHSLLVGVGG